MSKTVALIPTEQLKTHKSGRFEVTEKMLLEHPDIKDLERSFNQTVFDNPEFIFISHWDWAKDGSFASIFVVEWQWMPWRQNESGTNAGSNSQGASTVAR